MDAYRLSGSEDFAGSGGAELLGEPEALCVIEWAERVAGALPDDAALIDIEVGEDGSRRLRLDAPLLEGLLA